MKVAFEDGREIEFNGVSAKPIEVGQYYLITYDGMNRIVEIKVTTPELHSTME